MQTTTPMTKINERLSVPSHTHKLLDFSGVSTNRSIWRAIRKGNVSKFGKPYPVRPFNNRKRTLGRKIQKDFEKINMELKIKRTLMRAKLIDKENV